VDVSFDIWVIYTPNGDRPYVSTTQPARDRIETAKREGWNVWRVPMVATGEKLLPGNWPERIV
jgi:hypothetical protein